MNIKISSLLLIAFLSIASIESIQAGTDDVIFKAMNDELARNMKLSLEKHNPPFFIAYQVSDTKFLNIDATLGAIIQSLEVPSRERSMRLMMGDYALNDENFEDEATVSHPSGNLRLPLDDDYNAIRRTFWITSDQVYKSAIESYEKKLTAIKQLNKIDNVKLDDYSRISPVNYVTKEVPVALDKTKWENEARELSGLFKTADFITNSSVRIFYIHNSYYYSSSEGSNLKIPAGIAYITVSAATQATDGEPIADDLTYYAPTLDQLPSIEKIKQDVQKLTDNLALLRKAPVIEDSYSGPLLLEGEAVAKLFTPLFDGDGLIATREPVNAHAGPQLTNKNNLQYKINQKICPQNITITAIPKFKVFNNIPLVGSFDIDGEGVVPKDELVLIDKGFLRTLLNDRVPTAAVKESNGHCRVGPYGNIEKAPGVIDVSYSKGKSLKSLRKEALKEAKKNGLQYIYVVRRFYTPGSSDQEMPVSQPLAIYKVMVKTGEEQLVRSAYINQFGLSDLKQIAGATTEQLVYNTMISSGGPSMPASFILPQAVVLNEVTIEKDKGARPKLPIVPNPVAAVK